MSQENVEVVRRVYEAVARGDSEAVLALYDPGSRGTGPDFQSRGCQGRPAPCAGMRACEACITPGTRSGRAQKITATN
jgi:hypothetical protein